jgi:hypothetical protein
MDLFSRTGQIGVDLDRWNDLHPKTLSRRNGCRHAVGSVMVGEADSLEVGFLRQLNKLSRRIEAVGGG